MCDILRLVSDSPADSRVCEVVEEMRRTREEVRVKREMLGLVRVVLEFGERLESVRVGLRNGRVKFAAEGLRELKLGLRVCDDDGDDRVCGEEPLVYGLLRKEWSQLFEEVLDFSLVLGVEISEENVVLREILFDL